MVVTQVYCNIHKKFGKFSSEMKLQHQPKMDQHIFAQKVSWTFFDVSVAHQPGYLPTTNVQNLFGSRNLKWINLYESETFQSKAIHLFSIVNSTQLQAKPDFQWMIQNMPFPLNTYAKYHRQMIIFSFLLFAFCLVFFLLHQLAVIKPSLLLHRFPSLSLKFFFVLFATVAAVAAFTLSCIFLCFFKSNATYFFRYISQIVLSKLSPTFVWLHCRRSNENHKTRK